MDKRRRMEMKGVYSIFFLKSIFVMNYYEFQNVKDIYELES